MLERYAATAVESAPRWLPYRDAKLHKQPAAPRRGCS